MMISQTNLLKKIQNSEVTASCKPKLCTCHCVDPAFWAGKEKLASASRDDERKEIVCNVCAEPPVKYFTWEFEGREPRDGIEKNVRLMS